MKLMNLDWMSGRISVSWLIRLSLRMIVFISFEIYEFQQILKVTMSIWRWMALPSSWFMKNMARVVLCLVTDAWRFSYFPDKFMKNAKKSMMPDNCNCPCREYWTTKCSVEYSTECKNLYSHRECKKIPHEKPMKVKETECQKCIQYYETVMETKSVR